MYSLEIQQQRQLTHDFDFFVIDKYGFVGHFASNCSILPSFLSRPFNEHKLSQTAEMASVLPDINSEYLVSSFVKLEEFKDELSIKNYLASYSFYSKKGMYSYDYDTINHTVHEYTVKNNLVINKYNLITSPINKLHFEQLPPELKELIRKNLYYGEFSTSEVVTLL